MRPQYSIALRWKANTRTAGFGLCFFDHIFSEVPDESLDVEVVLNSHLEISEHSSTNDVRRTDLPQGS